MASKDLPFGIIPKQNRKKFAECLNELYPKTETDIINKISESEKPLIIALFKGFKPKGDDNRPDRGLLPLISMLSSSNSDIFTIIYGPIIKHSLNLLEEEPLKLSKKNGLWCSILALSDFLLLDAPVLGEKCCNVEKIYDNKENKNSFCNCESVSICKKPTFSNIPLNFGEDDVDAALHYLFAQILSSNCFEGMCNPPGGDWSGFSIINQEFEYRWLSLPRVSDVVDGKRPDHIIEITGLFDLPILLSIESKEKSVDLENDVGVKLISYIKRLMNFIPSAKREIKPQISAWQWGDEQIKSSDFEFISAAAYLKKFAQPEAEVFCKKCEILFVMNPIVDNENLKWEIEIAVSSERSKILKEFIINLYKNSNDKQFIIK